MQTAIVIMQYSQEVLEVLPRIAQFGLSFNAQDQALIVFRDEDHELASETVEILRECRIAHLYFKEVRVTSPAPIPATHEEVSELEQYFAATRPVSELEKYFAGKRPSS